jgi:hypothetical protein
MTFIACSGEVMGARGFVNALAIEPGSAAEARDSNAGSVASPPRAERLVTDGRRFLFIILPLPAVGPLQSTRD